MRPVVLQRITLSPAVVTELTALAASPLETCGLLAGATQKALGGDVAAIAEVHLLRNNAQSATFFSVTVEAMLLAQGRIVDRGQRPLAFFHSHPDGCTALSFRDRLLPRLVAMPVVIVALADDELRLAAHQWNRNRIREIQVLRSPTGAAGNPADIGCV